MWDMCCLALLNEISFFSFVKLNLIISYVSGILWTFWKSSKWGGRRIYGIVEPWKPTIYGTNNGLQAEDRMLCYVQ